MPRLGRPPTATARHPSRPDRSGLDVPLALADIRPSRSLRLHATALSCAWCGSVGCTSTVIPRRRLAVWAAVIGRSRTPSTRRSRTRARAIFGVVSGLCRRPSQIDRGTPGASCPEAAGPYAVERLMPSSGAATAIVTLGSYRDSKCICPFARRCDQPQRLRMLCTGRSGQLVGRCRTVASAVADGFASR